MNPTHPSSSQELTCDLLVVGSGAGGLSTAIAAKKHGLNVIVIEKAPCFGGTTAFSGGVLWIPGNTQCAAPDTREAMRTGQTFPVRDLVFDQYRERPPTAASS